MAFLQNWLPKSDSPSWVSRSEFESMLTRMSLMEAEIAILKTKLSQGPIPPSNIPVKIEDDSDLSDEFEKVSLPREDVKRILKGSARVQNEVRPEEKPKSEPPPDPILKSAGSKGPVKSRLAWFDDGKFRIVTDYRSGQILVHGETISREIKDNILKPLGFRFSSKYIFGPGWVGPADRLQELLASIEQANMFRNQRIEVITLSLESMKELERKV